MPALFSRLAGFRRNLFARQRVERELDDELRAYLDHLIDENLAAGMHLAEARRAAIMELGGIDQVKEEVRQVRSGRMLEQSLQDLRYGARTLRKNPAFTLVAVLALSLGIGANTAIFSVVNAVLLRPLPYPDGGRLAIIWSEWGHEARGPASGPELVELRRRSRAFTDIAGVWVTSGAFTGNAEPEQVRLGMVTANFLPLLAAKPQLGRFFAPGEDRGGNRPVMMLTDGLWRRQFGADPSIAGRTARFNGNSFTIAGVLPPDFKLLFPEGSSVPPDVQVFIPFLGDLEQQNRSQAYIRLIGKLRPGVTVAQAQSEAEGIAAELRKEFQDFAGQELHLTVLSLHGDDVRAVHPALLTLFVAVGLVLLITCANVANLLLSRGCTRRREMALRAALGAAKSRIVMQLLTESILLAVLGGAAALGVGWMALRWLISMQPEGILRLIAVPLDGPVLAFTLVVSLATGILFGLGPAWAGARGDLVEALKESGRNATPGKDFFRRLLVVAEVGLSFMLLVGTGLMIRTFVSLLHADPGFRPAQVLTFQLAPPYGRYANLESVNNFLRQLRANLAAVPGTQSVSGVSHLPLDEGMPNWYSYYWPEGAPAREQNTLMADHRATFPGYFRSIGAVVLAGREFEETDDAAHTHVAIVDDRLAAQTWPGQNPVGKKLSVEDSPAGVYEFVREPVVIVGVVRHLQSHSLTSAERGQIYVPFALAPRPQISLVVRTDLPTAAFAIHLRRELKKLDKGLPFSNLRPEQDYLDKARAQTRFVTMLGGALAAIALVLASIGIYGVASYAAAQRTGEFAIRLALGARAGDIRALVLRQSALPMLVGLAAGVLLARALTPLLSGLLYGVRAGDPLVFISIAAFLAVVGVAAGYLPALRATRVDPITALRLVE